MTRILIVDDESGQRRSLAIALKFEGFFVLEAGSAEEAIQRLEETSADAALVDIVMPGVNGIELARQIRDAHPDIKVVLVSAYHLSPRQVLQSGTGAVAFLPKPYRMSALVSFLKDRITHVDPADPVILEA